MRQALLVTLIMACCQAGWCAGPEWVLSAAHTPRQPKSGQAVSVRVETVRGVTEIRLEYQVVEPGSYIELRDAEYGRGWVAVPMRAQEGSSDGSAFVAEVPAAVQKHRRLVRYRVRGRQGNGQEVQWPPPDAECPNYAYFVDDGNPPWTGAVNPRSANPKQAQRLTFSARTMQRVQTYHLIGKKRSIENVTWLEQAQGKQYRYTGTLVANGIVYDHVRYRARGGMWRYATGKNMWKVDFPKGHRLHARDDFGRPYPVSWSKLNLRPCIQMGTHGQRGEQGMFETVGFRLFNLAGVEAPWTHWIQLRIVDEAEEGPANQYQGDFWGLYLAIENEDGRFLKGHGLPDGNLYKMANGTGELEHTGEGQPTDGSDLERFMRGYEGFAATGWWRKSVDLPSYYSYRAICECIHHYDIGGGKNYDYFHNPRTGQWQVIPWDIDLTWADDMYGDGEEPFKRRVLADPVMRVEYQNRLREIRDLLYNPEEMERLIDESAAVIWDSGEAASLVEADRRKWDFHPMMREGVQAGQGLFYRASTTGDFAGMVKRMKDYVRSRGEWMDGELLDDPKVPATPTATYSGEPGYRIGQLRFKSSAYVGSTALAGVEWRLAEVTAAGVKPGSARYEIVPVWTGLQQRAAGEVSVPAKAVAAGHRYRVRVRMKDATGRCSHWSAPVEFVAGGQ